MEQLNLYDYYENLAKNTPVPAKVQKTARKKPKIKPQPKKVTKPPKVKPPDLVFSIGKRTLPGNITIDDAFAPWGELGLAKLILFRNSGIADVLSNFHQEVIRGIKYVRGDYEKKFRNLDDSVISYGFTEPAARRLKALAKEYRRRNIRLKIDVANTEVANV